MIDLQPGDKFFLVQNKNLLQKGINLVQRFWSWIRGRDGKSDTPHTGIILNAGGDTFESNWIIGKYNLQDYKGCKLRIYRDDRMTQEAFYKGWNAVKIHDRQIYPVHRLVYFLSPGLAETLHLIPKPVCSELVGKFLFYSGMRKLPYWGTDVDELQDWVTSNPHDKKIFEGVWQ